MKFTRSKDGSIVLDGDNLELFMMLSVKQLREQARGTRIIEGDRFAPSIVMVMTNTPGEVPIELEFDDADRLVVERSAYAVESQVAEAALPVTLLAPLAGREPAV